MINVQGKKIPDIPGVPGAAAKSSWFPKEFLKGQQAKKSLADRDTLHLLSPGSEVGLRLCIPNKPPGDADAAVCRPHPEQLRTRTPDLREGQTSPEEEHSRQRR